MKWIDKLATMADMTMKGSDLKEIAKKYGVTKQRISQLLKKSSRSWLQGQATTAW